MIVVLRQRIGGVDVIERDAKVLLDENLSLVAIGGALHPAAFAHSKLGRFALGAEEAAARAFDTLYPPSGSSTATRFVAADSRADGDDAFVLAGGTSADGVRLLRPVRAKRVYFPAGERLVPAYAVEIIAEVSGPAGQHDDAYALLVAADDGRILRRRSLVHHAAYTYRVFADASGRHTPMDGPIANLTPHPTGLADKTSVSFVPPNLITIDGFNATRDPWLPAGATETRGNNVDAYTDDDVDGFSAGDLRASVTAPGTFDRLFDVSLEPTASTNQRMAAVTNAFFVTNWLHDDWYDVGFDEASGNAQASNYGRGGSEGDPLLVQVQDSAAAGKRNNANAMTPADGSSPRLQFYLWDGPIEGSLTVTPGGSFAAGAATFGPQSFTLEKNIVLASGPAGSTACGTLSNVTDKVVLIDRGGCTYESKAKNAQNAGATGVIIANNTAGEIAPMTDDPVVTGVTIPVLSITQAAGTTIKAQLQGNAVMPARMHRTSSPARDSALDASIIAHEWGHYLHHRLVRCSTEQCGAESEGWADFIALHMSLRPGDQLGGTFAVAQYSTPALSSDTAYFGLRRFPYSVDFTKNALTFKHITNGVALPDTPMNSRAGGVNAEVHNAGEVWASMLWEAYVALQRRAAGPAPAYTFDEARKRMASYVVGGMKLAPANPTYTEQRDALLAAAFARDAADGNALAEGFARRGAGSCAVSPARDSSTFDGVVESFELKADASIASIVIDDAVLSCDTDGIIDAGETGRAVVRITNRGGAALVGAQLAATTSLAGVTFPKGATIAVPAIAPFTTLDVPVEIALAAAITGQQQLDVSFALTTPGACSASVSASASVRANIDEKSASSATDDVEATTTTWTATDLDASSLASTIWKRVETAPIAHAWHADDYTAPSDTALVSPAFDVGAAGSFTVTFSHRYRFESDNGVHYDGAVIEVSSDDGVTWVDASTLATPGYGGDIGDPTGAATNTLRGRRGYVAESAGWPARTTETLDFGSALAGKRVKLRFRVATDDAVGATGWEIDDIHVTGALNTPFAAIVDDDGVCTNIPTANAGPDQTVSSGATVKLDGSRSATTRDAGTLAFAWKQTAGPTVTLSEGTSVTATFTAPPVTAKEKLTFELSVRDGLASATDTVDVVVEPKANGPDGAGGEGGGAVDVGSGEPEASGGGPGTQGGGCRSAGGAGSSGSGLGASALALALATLVGRRRRSK
ncbi:MAG: M36 family metallopeptidase [Myxococcales bacterium]|nr:M36 family metallopeptidase [Myxococcales bacterium]